MNPAYFSKLGLPEEIDLLSTLWQWVGRRVQIGEGKYQELLPMELAVRPLLVAGRD